MQFGSIPARRKFALCFQSGKFPETCLFIRAHYFPSVEKNSPLVAIGLAFCSSSGHKKQQKGKNNRSFENVSVKMVHLRINFYTVGRRKKNRATPFAKKLTAACYFGDLSSNCTHLLWRGVFQNTSHQQCCLAAARATQEGPCSPTLHNFTGTGVFFQGNI